jgi:hypothetical protein
MTHQECVTAICELWSPLGIGRNPARVAKWVGDWKKTGHQYPDIITAAQEVVLVHQEKGIDYVSQVMESERTKRAVKAIDTKKLEEAERYKAMQARRQELMRCGRIPTPEPKDPGGSW